MSRADCKKDRARRSDWAGVRDPVLDAACFLRLFVFLLDI